MPRGRHYVNGPADTLRPLTHDTQPHVSLAGGTSRGVEAVAVIANG